MTRILFLTTTLVVLSGSPEPLLAAKCFWVSSYHRGYEWNDGIERGLETVLKGHCKLKKFFLDTKRNTDPKFGMNQALAAKKEIDSFQPDVLIASDDNASKYLIQPFFKDKALPIVFCGLNQPLKAYGYPYKNATGMVEVAPILPLLKSIRTIIKNPKQGVYLGSNVLTDRSELAQYKAVFEDYDVKLIPYLVDNLKDWKRAFLSAQQSDFIIMANYSGISYWNREEALKFIRKNNRLLTVTSHKWMMPFAMLGITKVPEEQGHWAGMVATVILDGLSPDEIPISPNRRWLKFINEGLVKSAKITFPYFFKHSAIGYEYP